MQTLISPAAPTERVGRYPKHTFQTKERCWTAQPFMIAPVLPGETLQSLYFESRVVSDPILNSRIGWKKEFYFFYVRITDLLTDAIRDMFIDPTNTDLTATLGAASIDAAYYQPKGGIDYLKRATDAIVLHYFRDQDETAAGYTCADGIRIVQFRQESFLDSLTDKDIMPEGANIATATTAGDLDRLMDAFNALRAVGIANMTYEDWLRSQGIAIPTKDENKPELLARFSDFAYPANTIDPSNGTPRSAMSWVFKNSSRDPKFFKEPGFVIGISVTRPKVYFSGLQGYAAAFMGRAWDWMPNYLAEMPETSLKKFTGDTGPLGDRLTAPDGYWLDMRDLLLYGDQWQNYVTFPANGTPADSGANHLLALPTGDTFRWKYPTEAQCKIPFVDTTNSYFVHQDGFASLSIKGAQVDWTKGSLANL